ncbi:MAG TPA: nitroreductase family protein [Jatrophihabitantaceae bacterium]|jgi:nitroreductase|nr:nitroreductase family protein [Jatrophihabitantaceae bacterium]
MEFVEAVRSRRMVRTYDPDRVVSRETIEGLLRLGTTAPSAGYSQGWRFLVLDDITSRTAFWAATSDADAPDPWLSRMQSAPALIVVFSDEAAYRERYAEPDKGSTPPAEQDWPVPYWHIDAGMAAMIILLGAVDVGLGALFFGVPTPTWPALRAAFRVPERLTPVGVVSLGYPAPDLRSPSLKRGRRPLDTVVTYGSF